MRRPLHFFGSLGLLSIGVGGAMLIYLAVQWGLGNRPIGNRPMLFYGLLLTIVGVEVLLAILSPHLIRAS